METPRVNEIPLALVAVEPDPFIADLEPTRVTGARPARPRVIVAVMSGTRGARLAEGPASASLVRALAE